MRGADPMWIVLNAIARPAGVDFRCRRDFIRFLLHLYFGHFQHNRRTLALTRELVQKDSTPRAPFELRDQIAANTFAALRIDSGV